jgi:hypothetical protein
MLARSIMGRFLPQLAPLVIPDACTQQASGDPELSTIGIDAVAASGFPLAPAARRE